MQQTARGWVSLLALADGAVLSHLLSAEERKAGLLAADGDLDLWARLADEGLPLAGGGMLRTRWALSPQELPRGSSSAMAGPEGGLEEVEDDTILTLRLRDGAVEVRAQPEQQGDQAGEAVAERVKTVVQACAGSALGALRAFADAAGVDHAEHEEEVGSHDEPSDPGAALDDVLAELLVAQPGVLDDPMPPLGLLLTAAGLEVAHGAVMLAGAPQDPDEVAGLSTEEIRWVTLARGFLRTQEADRVSAEELDRFLTVLTLSPLVLGRVADEVERDPADAALLEAARRASATPVRRRAAGRAGRRGRWVPGRG